MSSLREHRISAQHDYLYREARYALDYIINGRMVEENNQMIRYDGIIGSRKVEIRAGGQVAEAGKEIRLLGLNDVHIGTIKLDPNAATSLFFIDANGNYRRIIPQGFDGFDESDLGNPYTIDILFTTSNQDPSLIDIVLRLRKSIDFDFQQDPNIGRWLNVEMRSTVSLRNYYDTIIYRQVTQSNEG